MRRPSILRAHTHTSTVGERVRDWRRGGRELIRRHSDGRPRPLSCLGARVRRGRRLLVSAPCRHSTAGPSHFPAVPPPRPPLFPVFNMCRLLLFDFPSPPRQPLGFCGRLRACVCACACACACAPVRLCSLRDRLWHTVSIGSSSLLLGCCVAGFPLPPLCRPLFLLSQPCRCPRASCVHGKWSTPRGVRDDAPHPRALSPLSFSFFFFGFLSFPPIAAQCLHDCWVGFLCVFCRVSLRAPSTRLAHSPTPRAREMSKPPCDGVP